jgi:hypothetical protein
MRRPPSSCRSRRRSSARPTPRRSSRFEAWNSRTRAIPTLVFFFRERLCFARGSQIWMSSPGDFFNFADRDLNNEVTDDQAIIVTLSSDTADPIRWACETPQGLLVGTDGGEWLIGEVSPTRSPLSPSNIRANRQSSLRLARQLRPVPCSTRCSTCSAGAAEAARGDLRCDVGEHQVARPDRARRPHHADRAHLARLPAGAAADALGHAPRRAARVLHLQRGAGRLRLAPPPAGRRRASPIACARFRRPTASRTTSGSSPRRPSHGKQLPLRAATWTTASKDGGDPKLTGLSRHRARVAGLDPAAAGMDQFTFPILTQWMGEQVYMVVDGQPVGYVPVIKIGQLRREVLSARATGLRHAHRDRLPLPRACWARCAATRARPTAPRRARPSASHELWARFRNTCAAKVGPSLDQLETVRVPQQPPIP